MRTADFDFHLPDELIAATPLARRDSSRLLHVVPPAPPAPGSALLDPEAGTLGHHVFSDLPALLRPGDLLVVNNSRVIHARLFGVRGPGGGRVEVLLLNPAGDPAARARLVDTPWPELWEAYVRPGQRIKFGQHLSLADGRIDAEVVAPGPHAGSRLVRLATTDGSALRECIESSGQVPLPPYILRRRAEAAAQPVSQDRLTTREDDERYQTVYARDPGSVAAPTAGLHFTRPLLEELAARGIERTEVTLHVGAGTFRPVDVEDPTEHPIHEEWYSVSEEAARVINAARSAGRRIVAVGTTATRVLEHLTQGGRPVEPGSGETRLMILPGHSWKCVGAMITNFHLPKSTLLMLVASFAGRELMLRAYQEAIRERYRFYSYGDATLLERREA